jgi:hypothetical protein
VEREKEETGEGESMWMTSAAMERESCVVGQMEEEGGRGGRERQSVVRKIGRGSRSEEIAL